MQTDKNFKRIEYLNNLIAFKEKDLIKVVTGIRRCGKSTLFDLFIDYLKENGVTDAQIIKINLEEDENEHLLDRKKLHSYVKEKLVPDKMNYVFLDEVQKVPEFELACDSLYVKKNVDLYITGSNAYLLSGELATYLTGRYVEIKMLPLSFKEYSDWNYEQSGYLLKEDGGYLLTEDGKKIKLENFKSKEEIYDNYVFKSSFPYTIKLTSNREIKQYLDALMDSIFIKDIMTRKNFSDVAMLKSVTKFLFDNIGSITSSNNIAETMTKDGRKITHPTVDNYLLALTESFLFYKCDRYDVKGKNILKTGEKYYATDVGMRYNIFGKKDVDLGHILENIVYLELLRRGYSVYIGKVGENEVDFVAIGEYGEEYYQVAYTTKANETLERELKSLDMIKDHNPKYLLTMDKESTISYNGIKKINVLDWLLEKE